LFERKSKIFDDRLIVKSADAVRLRFVARLHRSHQSNHAVAGEKEVE
jgi:hypothetical protein